MKNEMRWITVNEIMKLVWNTLLGEEEKITRSVKKGMRQYGFWTQYIHGTLALSII